MNNKDAIDILLRSNEYHHARGDLPHSAASIEAFNKAIDALRAERPQGEWKIAFHDCTGAYYLCSCCGEGRAVINGGDYASLDEFKFCPNCGAKMEVSLNE